MTNPIKNHKTSFSNQNFLSSLSKILATGPECIINNNLHCRISFLTHVCPLKCSYHELTISYLRSFLYASMNWKWKILPNQSYNVKTLAPSAMLWTTDGWVFSVLILTVHDASVCAKIPAVVTSKEFLSYRQNKKLCFSMFCFKKSSKVIKLFPLSFLLQMR